MPEITIGVSCSSIKKIIDKVQDAIGCEMISPATGYSFLKVMVSKVVPCNSIDAQINKAEKLLLVLKETKEVLEGLDKLK